MELLAVLFYSLNKVFFLLKELAGLKADARAVRRWKMLAWAAGLIGLPFVVYILLSERDWIFGWLEMGAAPSMVLGILRAYSNTKRPMPKIVDNVFYTAIGAGFTWSYLDLGGLLSVNQGLEMVAVGTFVTGSYQLAKEDEDRNGYLLYMLMFAVTGTLLFRQQHYWFALQQVGSALVIGSAYYIAGKRKSC